MNSYRRILNIVNSSSEYGGYAILFFSQNPSCFFSAIVGMKAFSISGFDEIALNDRE